MFENVSKYLSVASGKPRSRVFRCWSLLCGFVVFLVVAPVILGAVGILIAQYIPLTVPRPAELGAGIPVACLGLGLLLWATTTFWRRGDGTPVPLAAPQKLVIEGPYCYCRNPIQLGANLYYIGIGCATLSVAAGIIMFIIGLVLGSAYHRFVEEPELTLRFGAAYEDYRKHTPFLWPRFRRKHPVA